ncbi:MAG: hypothetical protein KF712_14230 [Akkermansiaceae bacterium]|nr:hypothetical protein [Akkermansiaceae bacterium]
MNTILRIFAFIWISSFGAEGKPEIIRGTYAHPKAFWDTGAKLDEYGVNAVFIHGKGIDDATFKRAKAEGCKVFAEFPTLNGKYGDYVKNHPDAHPIDDSGNPAPPATWFMGVCPTHKGFREFRMKELRDLLGKYELDGIWMDYTHWHGQFEDPYPVLIKTCFNDSCLSEFEEWAGVEVVGKTPQEKAKWIFTNAARKWEDWRVHVIVDWAKEIRAITKEIRPNALVGIFHTAWKDEDLSGVRRRCLGLDFDALAQHVDVFSPMIYHGRSGKPPEYVEEFVAYLGAKPWMKGNADSYPQMWPIVQAHDDPRVSPEEFGKVLRYGLGGKSTGVMMFTIASVAKDPGKMEMMKEIYKGTGN